MRTYFSSFPGRNYGKGHSVFLNLNPARGSKRAVRSKLKALRKQSLVESSAGKPRQQEQRRCLW